MECEDKAPESAARTSAQFTSTHWSTVLAAGERASPGASEALERLCRTYWLPVFVFVRRKGYEREPAEDLTQGFFEQLIEKELTSRADPERGRFRNFPLKVLTQFLADERRRERALKRGMTERAVKVGVHRMRLRYRELLRAGVAQTVADSAEINDEIRFLFQVLSR